MQVLTSAIDGLIEFRPAPHRDPRGFFSRTFDVEVASAAGIDATSFVQDSMSRSRRGVLRGLHVRLGEGESKLVRCSSGELFDVVVDLRAGSASFGQWVSFTLSGDEQNSIYIPAGCAHGFQALTDPADTFYRIDRAFDPTESLTIAWDDPDLGIPWPLPVTEMSSADRGAPPLALCAEALRTLTPRQ